MAGSVCIITFSDNYDHQEVAYSMFNVLYPKHRVYSIGLTNPKYPLYPTTECNFYYDGPRRPGITKKSFDFALICRIVKKINSLDVSCVYFESEHLWNAFIMLGLKKSIKKVVVIHDVIPHKDSKGKKLANKVCCKMSDVVVIRNEKYKDTLSKMYNVSPQKVVFLPLWRFYPEFKESQNASYFLFFGRIRMYKGIDTMLDIIRECQSTKFVIAGSPDKESLPFVELIKKEKNATVIDRELAEREMEDLFVGAKAVILPYSSATQSGVVIDAYKYGKPVIALNVGAITEQIENGVSGFVVEGKDEFLDAIKRIDVLKVEDYHTLQKQSYCYGYKKYSVQNNQKLFANLLLFGYKS